MLVVAAGAARAAAGSGSLTTCGSWQRPRGAPMGSIYHRFRSRRGAGGRSMVAHRCAGFQSAFHASSRHRRDGRPGRLGCRVGRRLVSGEHRACRSCWRRGGRRIFSARPRPRRGGARPWMRTRRSPEASRAFAARTKRSLFEYRFAPNRRAIWSLSGFPAAGGTSRRRRSPCRGRLSRDHWPK